MNSKTIELTRKRWARVEEIFSRAVELAAEERERFLDAACDGDEPLRNYVLELLTADPAAEAPIERTIVNTVRHAFVDEASEADQS